MNTKLFNQEEVVMVNVPPKYQAELFAFKPPSTHPYKRIVMFVHSLEEMKMGIVVYETQLVENGLLIFIYPKLKNTLGIKGIHRDAIFPYLNVDETTGFVKDRTLKFNRLLKFDDDYTLVALKKISKVKNRLLTH